MTIKINPSSSSSALFPHHQNHHNNALIIKLLISFLISGLAIRLILSNYSIAIDNKTEHHHHQEQQQQPQHVSNFTYHINGSDDSPPLMKTEDFQQNGSRHCDIFVGNWVRDPSGPRYTNDTCRFIEPPQNCMRNGRPDSNYLYWKWSPTDCELPVFDPAMFLNSMKHKSWAFIGDSISRNHVQSLLCILSKEEEPIEVYHDDEFKSRRWHFSAHNLTLSVIWSPYLVQVMRNDKVSKE